MKRIIFVRHGETEANASEKYSNSRSRLTPLGKLQAQKVAERLKDEKFTYVYCSPYIRAKQTAKEIMKYHTNKMVIDKRIREHKRPSLMQNLVKTDPRAIEIENQVMLSFGEPGTRILDSESCEEIRERLNEFINELFDKRFEDVLIVGHEFMMRVMLTRFIVGDEWETKHIGCFIRTTKLSNTGIMEVRNDGKGWYLWSWNDIQHLS